MKQPRTLLCPACGDEFIPTEDFWWAVRGRYYCGQDCADAAQAQRRERLRRSGW